jgi:hypothetical protein
MMKINKGEVDWVETMLKKLVNELDRCIEL